MCDAHVTRFNGAPDRNPGKVTRTQWRRERDSVGFNGAPDRNPGKDTEGENMMLKWQESVSMEPQIGIRGRRHSWTRKIGEILRSSSFNGAPDRNPGKGGAGAVTIDTTAAKFQWSPR